MMRSTMASLRWHQAGVSWAPDLCASSASGKSGGCRGGRRRPAPPRSGNAAVDPSDAVRRGALDPAAFFAEVLAENRDMLRPILMDVPIVVLAARSRHCSSTCAQCARLRTRTLASRRPRHLTGVRVEVSIRRVRRTSFIT